MTDPLQSIGEKIKDFCGNWASYSAAGSFALYVLGYLALRFHLTALGVGIDLSVLDERYLFAGAKWVVYLASAAATVMFLGLLLATPVYGVYLLLAVATGGRSSAWIARAGCRAITPTRLTLAGMLFSAAFIQRVMKDCFAFDNLLLRDTLPPDSALSNWLLQDDGTRLALYFYGLVGAAMVSGTLLLATCSEPQENPVRIGIWRLFAFLVAVQWLLLPVNYGYLVMDKQLPEVASMDGTTPLPPGREAWLAWESKDYLTFLLLDRKEKPVRRSLLTVPRAQVKTIEIIAYEPIFSTLFDPQQQENGNDKKK